MSFSIHIGTFIMLITFSTSISSSKLKVFVERTINSLDSFYNFDNFIIISEDPIYFTFQSKCEYKSQIIFNDILSKTLKEISIPNTLLIIVLKEQDHEFNEHNLNSINFYKTIILDFSGLLKKFENFTFEKQSLFYENSYNLFFVELALQNYIIISENEISGELQIGYFKKTDTKISSVLLNFKGKPVNEWFPNILQEKEFQLYSKETDIPRVYFVNNESIGVSGTLFSNFLKNLNLKTKVTENYAFGDVLNVQYLMRFLTYNIFEMSPYIVSLTEIDSKQLIFSYPIQIIEWKLMVPIQKEIPKYLYITYPFTLKMWILIAFICIYIGIILKIITKTQDSILYPIAFSIQMSIPNISEPQISVKIILVLLFIYGFIISNFYLAYLSSFLTSKIEGKQIDSVEDVLKTNISIAITYPDYAVLIKSESFEKLLSNMVFFTVDDFNGLRNSLDTNYLYPISSDDWEMLNIKGQSVFRLANFTFLKSLRCFVLSRNSVLEDFLNKFILKSQSSGIADFWSAESLRMVFPKGKKEEFQEFKPFGLVYYYGTLVLIAIGWVLGGFFVFLEFMYFQIKKKWCSFVL